MRNKTLKAILLTLIALCLLPQANAQYRTATDNIIGMDLEQVERVYRRALNRGDSTYTIHYAEALFIRSEFEKAFEMYQRADALGQIQTIYQKRDYQHAALRIGKQSPYAQKTGYFSSELYWIVHVNTFCANSSREDFAPFYWRDILFITSSRGYDEEKYPFTSNPFLNVHAFIHDCISVNLPDALPRNINTPNHDGPIALSEDGNLFIITRNHLRRSSDGIKNLYLEYYTREANRWSEGKMFPLFDIEFSVQHPFYSDSDSTLYFSSNVAGGHGGFDLYKAKWNGKTWEEPINLGPEINSPYDEVFPAITPDGALIYSTNHIETKGGLDLVLFKNDTRYLLPEPLNTVHDDFSITFKDSSSGYFASNRSYQGFIDDIFIFNIHIPEYEYFVEVLDKETLEPIENVQVIFSSEVAEDTLNTSENGMGFLHTGRRAFYEYAFSLSKDDYEPKDAVSDNFVERDGDFVLTLLLEQVYPEGQFVVYFDNDRPDPRSRAPETDLTYQQTFNAYMSRISDYYNNSVNTREEIDAFFKEVQQGMDELTQLAQFLKEEFQKDRHYIITFTSHASPLASSEYNLILSKRRFVSVENYLKTWSGGQLFQFIEQGNLQYDNNPFGASLARPDVSDNRLDRARSIYSIAAARERRVTVSWRRKRSSGADLDEFDSFPKTSGIMQTQQNQHVQQVADHSPTTDDNEVEAPLITRGQNEYYIIVASFQSRQNAQNEANRLRSLYPCEATVLPSADNRDYRVSFNAYPSLKEAEAALNSIRRSFSADAWILTE